MRPRPASSYVRRAGRGIAGAIGILGVGNPDPMPMPEVNGGPSTFGGPATITYDYPLGHRRRGSAGSMESDDAFRPAALYEQQEDEDPSLLDIFLVADANRDPVDSEMSTVGAATDATMEMPARPNDFDGGADRPEEVETSADDSINLVLPELTMLRESYLPTLYSLYAPHSTDLQCDSARCQRRWEAAESDKEKKSVLDGWTALFRCRDCFGGHISCAYCLHQDHRLNPFHSIEYWDDEKLQFKRTSLSATGFVWKLGHQGHACPAVVPRDDDPPHVVFVHVNGMHSVSVQYCECPKSAGVATYQQLLLECVFPATHDRPASGFTFTVLKHFVMLNHASKTPVYEYHKALVNLTDAVDPAAVQNTYKNFCVAVRQWRVLRMLMNAGKFHASDLEPGELVVRCPACPNPKVNLPVGWEKDQKQAWMYAMFLSGDGNFHLHRRDNHAGTGNIAAILKARSMIGDAGFWAPQAKFDTYINATSAIPEARSGTSECNTMAGDPQKGKPSGPKNLLDTGVFGNSCRHVFLLPLGIIDFHRGERYRYVDVAVASVLAFFFSLGIVDFVFAYDIACKYSINFMERATESFRGVDSSILPLLPPAFAQTACILWLIGKFHLGSHRDECLKKYSFNFTRGVGRMSGELVETIWSYFDYLKYQTREMSQGARKEMLTDSMNWWNWQKLVKLVRATIKSYHAAAAQTDHAKFRLEGVQANIADEDLAKFKEDYLTRGGDQFLPDKDKIKYPSRMEVFNALKKAEHDLGSRNAVAEEEEDEGPMPGASDLINNALDLEITLVKYRLLASRSRIEGWPGLSEKVENLRKKLEKGLEAHYEALTRLAPTITGHTLRPADPIIKDPILLPSQFTPEQRTSFHLEALTDAERQLRVGHAHDMVARIRAALGIRSYMSRHAVKSNGYRESKQAQQSIRRAETNVNIWRAIYNVSWAALERLGVTGPELRGLQRLEQEHLVMLSDWLEHERYRSKVLNDRLPWIWTIATVDMGDGSDESQADQVRQWNLEVLRLEWVHAKAAADRWIEELNLLREELRRMPISFKHIADQWRQRAIAAIGDAEIIALGTRVQTGYVAYAMRQSGVFTRLSDAAQAQYDSVAPAPSAESPEAESRAAGDDEDVEMNDGNEVDVEMHAA